MEKRVSSKHAKPSNWQIFSVKIDFSLPPKIPVHAVLVRRLFCAFKSYDNRSTNVCPSVVLFRVDLFSFLFFFFFWCSRCCLSGCIYITHQNGFDDLYKYFGHQLLREWASIFIIIRFLCIQPDFFRTEPFFSNSSFPSWLPPTPNHF